MLNKRSKQNNKLNYLKYKIQLKIKKITTMIMMMAVIKILIFKNKK